MSLKLNIDTTSRNNFVMYTDKKAKIILQKHNQSLKQKFKYLYSNVLETAETTTPKHFIKNLTNVHIHYSEIQY